MVNMQISKRGILMANLKGLSLRSIRGTLTPVSFLYFTPALFLSSLFSLPTCYPTPSSPPLPSSFLLSAFSFPTPSLFCV